MAKDIEDYKYRKHEVPKWMEDLEKAFPLPDAPSELCRDAFLEELLKPYGVPEPSEESSESTESRLYSIKIRFGTLARSIPDNTEEKLLNDYVKLIGRMSLNAKKSKRSAKLSETASTTATIDINKLMKGRYDSIATALGFISVLFQLQELKDRLLVVRDYWQLNVSYDKSVRLFSWSIQDYYSRFNMNNQVYLDTMERDLKDQMECFKFRMDLREIIRLVDGIAEDFRLKRDICINSMLLIKDAEKDILQLLNTSRKLADEEYKEITLTNYETPKSADPRGSRKGSVTAKVNYNDFVYPIEARYHINYVQASMDQAVIKATGEAKAMQDELDRLRLDISETQYFWEVSGLAFEMEIMNLKKRISDMEMEYEKNMEFVENEIEMTRSRFVKAKEDLKNKREEIPFFHAEIARVQELIARQEEERLHPLVLTSKRNTPKRKSKKKEKKY